MGNDRTPRAPGDDRADALNPTSAAHKAARDNRANQLNPNNWRYWASRGRDEAR